MLISTDMIEGVATRRIASTHCAVQLVCPACQRGQRTRSLHPPSLISVGGVPRCVRCTFGSQDCSRTVSTFARLQLRCRCTLPADRRCCRRASRDLPRRLRKRHGPLATDRSRSGRLGLANHRSGSRAGQAGNHVLRVTGMSKYQPPLPQPAQHRLAQGREGRRLRAHRPRPEHEPQRRRPPRPVRLLGPPEPVRVLLRPLRREGRPARLPDLHRQQRQTHDDHQGPSRGHALDRRLARRQSHPPTSPTAP